MPVRRWLAGVLGAVYLVDVVLYLADHTDLSSALVPLPLFGCLMLALSRPLSGAAAAAVWLAGGSAVMHEVGWAPDVRVGASGLLLSELVAGGALIAVVVWRCRGAALAGVVAALTAAGAAAVVLRSSDLFSSMYYYRVERIVPLTGLIGLVVLIAGCVAGLALRAHEEGASGGMSPESRALARRQWPLAGALLVFVLLDLTSSSPSGGLSTYVLELALMLATGACAVLGPRNPVRYAVVAAGLLTAAAMLVHPTYQVVALHSFLPVPTSVAVAHMALVSYLVRYADRRLAAVGVVAIVGADVLTILLVGADGGTTDFLLLSGFLLVVSAATGQYFRSRDRERAQSVRAAVTGAQQAERLALARELHDVVAHHVTGIVVAAQAARLVAERNPTAAAQALDRIEHAGTEALTAMRTLVGSMRGAAVAGAEGQATMDLESDLRALTANVAGPIVDLDLALPPTLPPEAGRSVLRIVQESLTNVGKHARDAMTVHIGIRVNDADELVLRVVDDAPQPEVPPAGDSSGYGLVGMRERIDLLGGRFTAGPGERAGWVVEAAFPLRRDEP